MKQLAARYPDSLLYDDLIVTWAAALPDAKERAAELEACVQRFAAGSSAAPQALFLLADMEILAPADDQPAERRAAGLARMRDVAARFAGTYWGAAAAARLGMLETPADGAPRETVQR